MSAADDPKRTDSDRTLKVVMTDGTKVTLPYRKAVSLLSRGLATDAPVRAKKLSGADADGVQDPAETGNKPSSGAPDDSGRS